MVKIGMTTDTVERRLELANRRNEFMCGTWSSTQKVKTNDVTRTKLLSHILFKEYWDKDSVSSEMYLVPPGMTVKQMADTVRDKDKVYVEHKAKEAALRTKAARLQAELKKLHKKHNAQLSIGRAVSEK